MGTQDGKELRMEAHVKAYLVQKFETGCRTGQKEYPVQVARKVKIVKDDAEHLLFTPQEWRTAQQIKSFFLTAISSPATDTNGKRYE